MTLDAVSQNSQNLAFNAGAMTGTFPNLSTRTISAVFGDTPNLSTLASLYLFYRIRGIKLKITAWPTAGREPLLLFTNAASTTEDVGTVDPAGPNPSFPLPAINILPEQRWSRYAVVRAADAGAKPTSLKVYYSVNKVYGPDAIVKNDSSFTGEMTTAAPYWSDGASGDPNSFVRRLAWLQWGLFTMNGTAPTETHSVTLKVEATVYTQFWGKRLSTS